MGKVAEGQEHQEARASNAAAFLETTGAAEGLLDKPKEELRWQDDSHNTGCSASTMIRIVLVALYSHIALGGKRIGAKREPLNKETGGLVQATSPGDLSTEKDGIWPNAIDRRHIEASAG